MADGSPGASAQLSIAGLDHEHLVIGFAGGGGSSNAARKAYGRDPDVAINHDPDAIKMHAANHPGCLHLQDDIRSVDFTWAIPRGPVEMAWLSPSCQHFSKALGGKPRTEQRRALCDVAIPLMRERKPRLVIIENVAEWGDWGPLGVDGKPIKAELGVFFRDFVAELRAQRYLCDWRVLESADYGMPSFRRRLYLVARRDAPPAWPAPTHGPGRIPHRTAASILDFSLPCPSIFDYRRGAQAGHTLKTQARIARGFRAFVLEREPFVIGDAAFFGIVKGYGERVGQRPRTWDLAQPLPTVVAGGVKQRLCVVWIRKDNGGTTGQRVDEPLHTVTCKDTKRLMAVPFGPDVETPERVRAWFAEWLPGVPPVVPLGGVDYPIADIGARVLTPRELARAMGFPDTYALPRKSTVAVARIGNAVTEEPAASLIQANAAHDRKGQTA